MKITVTRDDGTEVDVTTGVQVAYDTANQSMDWGSGFLDYEEMVAIAKLGEACGFPSATDLLAEIQRDREEQQRQQEELDRKNAEVRREAEEIRALWIDLLPQLTSTDYDTAMAAQAEADRRVKEYEAKKRSKG